MNVERRNAARPSRVAHQRARYCVYTLLCALVFGCKADAERRERAEIERLVEHIDRLRDANNAEKPQFLAALQKLDTIAGPARELWALCVGAYEVHQRALDAIDALAALADVDGGAPGEVKARFGLADRELLQALILTERCASARVELTRPR